MKFGSLRDRGGGGGWGGEILEMIHRVHADLKKLHFLVWEILHE